MLLRPDLFTVPYWALVLRLPLQVALLALIAWTTFRKTRSQQRLMSSSIQGCVPNCLAAKAHVQALLGAKGSSAVPPASGIT